MTGWSLAATLFGVFWLGGYVALVCRALLEDARERRIQAAARESLSAREWAVLREYLGRVDEHERSRISA